MVPSSTEVLDSLNSSMKVGINFFQTSVNVDVLTFYHESRKFLMTCKNSDFFFFPEDLVYPDPSGKLPSIAAVA